MVTLGYWGFRGLAQPIRFLLAYLGIEYTNKAYSNPDDWFGKDKQQLGLEFPNIPYLIDGDMKVTESTAIPVYLIKKYNRPELLGQNADGSYSEKEVRVQQIMGVLKDIFKEMVPVCFKPDFITAKDVLYKEKLDAAFKRVVAYLGDKEFLVGTLSYADFFFYEILSYARHLYPQSITPNFNAFINRFENLPGIKQYLANPNIDIKIFLFPNRAVWVGPQ